MINYFNLLRVKHYIKNFIIFAPLLFTYKISDFEKIFITFEVFFLFCINSSIIYIFNDLKDFEYDSKHPKKKKIKPIASGKVKKSTSWIIIILLLIISATLLFYISNYKILIISIIFIFANLAYTEILKKIVIIDILTLSSNYVIRAYAGSVIINVDLSNWMAITIFFGALFLSSLKRKQELLLYGTKSRPALKKYTLKSIKKIVDFSGIVTIIFYSIYILTINAKLIITIPVILYGFFKYQFISDRKNFSDSPVDEILNNKDIILTILIWILLILIL